MMRNYFLLWFYCCCSIAVFGQTSLYQGQVVDEETGEELVFVSIQRVGTQEGTVSDLDGHFELSAARGDQLVFSYVGYDDFSVTLGETHELAIRLSSAAVSLTEIVVRPVENPAWRIIRAVLDNRDRNDPGQYPGYSYRAYHKTVLSVDTLVPPLPSKRNRSSRKQATIDRLRRDSLRRALFQNDMHLWVTETISQNHFRAPSQRMEKVLATQSSLPNDFTGGINPVDFQPFGFYQEIIRLEFTQQNYVNPISRGTFQHYDFSLVDTIVHAQDTTFVVQFKPLAGKYFTALKGLLYIHTDGFALENVIAEPADPQQTLQFVIKQQCQRMQGKWFPNQLHVDLFFQIGMKEALVVYGFRNRSIISEVDLNPPEGEIFNHYRREISANTPALDDSLRAVELNSREQNTYSYWDSLPSLRQPYRLLKAYNGMLKIAASGLISGKLMEVVVPDILQLNAYEDARLGLGIKTSPLLSSTLSAYAYAAYGFRDERWKYGGTLEGKLYAHRDLRLRLSYQQDLIEPGGVNHLSSTNQAWSAWSARNLILSRLDEQKRYRADLVYRPSTAWQLNLFGQQEERRLTYAYAFGQESEPSPHIYTNRSYGLRLRWAPQEQLIKMGELEALLYPAYPIIDISLSRNDILNGGDSFVRISGRLQHEQRWKYLGSTEINIQAGWLDKAVPYPFLFQAPGNGGNGIGGNGLFNSAGFTEFVNQEYAYLFLTHNFGTLLGRMATPYFRPELLLIQQVGWGRLKMPELHRNLDFQDMQHTYLESGVGVKNLLRIPYFKLVYIGVGGSMYYRWGAYRLPRERDNWSFQLRVNFSV